jgi:hypothetical protein
LQAEKKALEAKLVAEWHDKIKRCEDMKEGKYVPDGKCKSKPLFSPVYDSAIFDSQLQSG